MSGELSRIATDFRGLAELLKEYRLRCNKSSHLVVHLLSLQVQAGRLLYEAIRNAAFPKECIDVNGQWWDCESNRLPGGLFTESNQTPTNKTYAVIWLFTISSWLTKAFLSRFRNKAASWDWKHVATDTEGRPVGKDGQPLRGRWYKNKEPLPENFVYDSDHHTAGDKYKWKREGELTYVHEGYDEADALEHARVRTEVYANACTVLAELIELGIAVQPGDVETVESHQASSTPPACATAKLSERKEYRDEKGFVVNPADNTAYVPMTKIHNEHIPEHVFLTTKQLTAILDANKEEIRQWQPRSHRRSVHLLDWLAYVESEMPCNAGDDWASPEDAKARKAVIDATKRHGK